jgi:30S ribosomal protein S31
MGKGDQRSRRGKLYRGTFGKSRPRKKNKVKGMAAKARVAPRRAPAAAAASAAAKKPPRKTTPTP